MGAAALLAIACAGTDGEPSTAALSKSHWTVARSWCPASCPPEILEFLEGFRGATVELAQDRVKVPFIDECEGHVSLVLQRTKVAAIVRALNEARRPDQPVTAQLIGLAGDTVTSGIANCAHDGLTWPLVRILAAEPDRVLLLFEDQSLVELR
jgi:hypothetical protein